MGASRTPRPGRPVRRVGAGRTDAVHRLDEPRPGRSPRGPRAPPRCGAGPVRVVPLGAHGEGATPRGRQAVARARRAGSQRSPEVDADGDPAPGHRDEHRRVLRPPRGPSACPGRLGAAGAGRRVRGRALVEPPSHGPWPVPAGAIGRGAGVGRPADQGPHRQPVGSGGGLAERARALRLRPPGPRGVWTSSPTSILRPSCGRRASASRPAGRGASEPPARWPRGSGRRRRRSSATTRR